MIGLWEPARYMLREGAQNKIVFFLGLCPKLDRNFWHSLHVLISHTGGHVEHDDRALALRKKSIGRKS